MSKSIKCKHCGSSEIEVDTARGDAVCMKCGSVLEDNIIVSEVQFEEGAHGSSSAVGQFVSSDSKGGATGFGKFPLGSGQESREVTLRKAKAGISHLCHQLNMMSAHYIDTACNFFKLALTHHLTRGRRNTHIYAACVYITCRTEETSHLLIDISDVLQICCYELGRTYLKLSQALCISIPSIDPCLYIMRFANKLELGEKAHEVSVTAQRLVQRMKKDSIHSGRRPSGLCGAALLLASRMHGFNRTPNDVVKIVKIHESTLRKRLIEFGETPSSALTLDEFMSVDLEAEQDPPAFKAARKKDKERILRLADADTQLSSLQVEIEAALEKVPKGRKRLLEVADVAVVIETDETTKFIQEETIAAIKECISEDLPPDKSPPPPPAILEGKGPDLEALCIPTPLPVPPVNPQPETDELDLTDINDDEIDRYIMTKAEADYKDEMWNKLNAEYLKMAKEREEKKALEGKPDKKKRRSSKRKQIGPSNTAGEAIEKMLQEKKISNKINYDILKSLTEPKVDDDDQPAAAISIPTTASVKLETPVMRRAKPILPAAVVRRKQFAVPSTSRAGPVAALPVVVEATEDEKPIVHEEAPTVDEKPVIEDDEDYEDDYDNDAPEEPATLMQQFMNKEMDEEYFSDDY